MTGPHVVPPTSPPGGFVLDASVPAAWVFLTRATAYTSGVLGRVLALKACVPNCWPLHLAEVLRLGERQGLRPAPEVDQFLLGLPAFPIFVEHDPPVWVWTDILPLARAHGVTATDASYLELAARLNLPLATADANLTRAANSAGVPLLHP